MIDPALKPIVKALVALMIDQLLVKEQGEGGSLMDGQKGTPPVLAGAKGCLGKDILLGGTSGNDDITKPLDVHSQRGWRRPWLPPLK